MAAALREMGTTTIRPHYKTHKTDLAWRQVRAGAAGLSMATVWEAAVLAAAGMDDLFVVNTVAHPDKIRVLAELAASHRILVAVDEAPNAAALSAAAVRAGSKLGVMIEVDTGMGRCGTDSEDDAVARPADPASRACAGRHHRLRGALHDDPRPRLRHERQQAAMASSPGWRTGWSPTGSACPIRSAGGVATWEWTAAYPGMTEIQAGTYVVMDNYHGQMVPGFEHSLTIQATVISRQSGLVIVDAGSKSVAAPADVTMIGHDHPWSGSMRSTASSARPPARRCGWATRWPWCPGTLRARSTTTTPSTWCATASS